MHKIIAAFTALITILTAILGLASYIGIEVAEKYHLAVGILALTMVLIATHILYHGKYYRR